MFGLCVYRRAYRVVHGDLIHTAEFMVAAVVVVVVSITGYFKPLMGWW